MSNLFENLQIMQEAKIVNAIANEYIDKEQLEDDIHSLTFRHLYERTNVDSSDIFQTVDFKYKHYEPMLVGQICIKDKGWENIVSFKYLRQGGAGLTWVKGDFTNYIDNISKYERDLEDLLSLAFHKALDDKEYADNIENARLIQESDSNSDSADKKQAYNKAAEIAKSLNKSVETLGSYGYGVKITDDEALDLYQSFEWDEDNSFDEFIDCMKEYPEAGEFGLIQITNQQINNDYYIIVSYAEL